jgi:helix-turn-helix protein
MPLFRWEDIDHSLVSLRLTDLAEEMHSQTRADETRIQFENRGNLNSNAVPSLVLKMKQDRADEWARRVYEIYCDVWQTQGYVKSAGFVRAVYARGIRSVLQARANAIAAEFSMFARRTSLSGALVYAHLQAHRLHMQRLEGRWHRRLEAEAKECDHAERRERLRAQAQAANLSATTKDVPEVSGNAPSTQNQLSAPKSPKSEPTDRSQREAVIRKVQNPQLYTVLSTPEAALYFEVRPRTIYRWRIEGKLKSGGRRGSISIESILRWQKKRSRKRPPV